MHIPVLLPATTPLRLATLHPHFLNFPPEEHYLRMDLSFYDINLCRVVSAAPQSVESLRDDRALGASRAGEHVLSEGALQEGLSTVAEQARFH